MAMDLDLKTRELEEKMEARLAAIEEESKIKNEEFKKLEISMETFKNPPISYICAYKSEAHISRNTLTFDSIYYKRTNEYTKDGGQNLATGIYTAPVSGTYTVTYNLRSYVHDGNMLTLFLKKNGITIVESLHRSEIKGASAAGSVAADMWEQGGKSLVTHLAKGDTMELFCANCASLSYRDDGVYDVLLCIELR